MYRVYYAGILSAAILAIGVPNQSQATFKKVFGITSTTDYLNQLIVLTQMQDTISQINDTNAKIIQEEKNIAAFNKKIEAELKKEITESEDQMQALAAEIIKQSELKTQDIQTRITTRQGNIANLQKGLGAESGMTKWAKTFNTLALGKLGTAVTLTQKMDAASQRALEDQISARRRSIADLQSQLSEEQKTLKDIFTSPEYQQQAQALKRKIDEYTTALSNILNAAARLRQENIFTPYNQKAQTLLKQLNTQVKDAKCDLIKSAGDTKSAIINQCKQQKLDAAKKAMTDKFPSCQSLTLTSTVDQINQCITFYRANR